MPDAAASKAEVETAAVGVARRHTVLLSPLLPLLPSETLLYRRPTCVGSAVAACTTWLQRRAGLNATRLLLTLAPANAVDCIFADEIGAAAGGQGNARLQSWQSCNYISD